MSETWTKKTGSLTLSFTFSPRLNDGKRLLLYKINNELVMKETIDELEYDIMRIRLNDSGYIRFVAEDNAK